MPDRLPVPTPEPVEHASKVVRFYDRMGENYRNWSPSLNIHFGYFRWGINPFRLETMLDQMSLEVLKRLNLRTEHPVVIDAGCGVGTASRFMLAYAPAARFCGVTISPWQAACGRSINREKGTEEQVSIFEADFRSMPFADGFADAAFAIESACYANGRDKAELVSELARVLKPGSRLVVVDGFKKHSGSLSAFLEKIYRRYLDLWAVGELAEMGLFRKALLDAGFGNIQTEDISWKVAPTAFHIPLTVLKLWAKTRLIDRQKLSQVQKDYIKALSLTLFMGIWKQHFGYYIVTCEKKTSQ